MSDVACRTSAEVADYLAGTSHPVRIAGAGSQSSEPSDVAVLRCSSMDRIVRLEPGDLTCSVEPGVRLEQLELELADHRLRLDCGARGTTVAGAFAMGDAQGRGPGAPTPRSSLLGLSGVLADGTSFKAGARVVKSVAGFDVPKLFVGSRGRLFVATELHLKLRPAPHDVRRFSLSCESEEQMDRFDALRRDAHPPATLSLRRSAKSSPMLAGSVEGRPEVVESFLRRHRLEPAATDPSSSLQGITVRGAVRPSRYRMLFEQLPRAADVAADGVGSVEVFIDEGSIDGGEAVARSVLHAFVELGGTAEIVAGAGRGERVPEDAALAALEQRVRLAFDPGERLR